MKKTYKFQIRFVLCIIYTSISIFSIAQKKNERADTVLWGNADAFLNRQTICMFDLIEQTLAIYPPKVEQSLPRKLALYNLDAILHETKYDQSLALHQFMTTRITSMLRDLSSPMGEGLEIYKLYNDGFVVRTKTVTIAFDLYREKTLISDSLMQEIVDRCDILFISHLHEDHADPQVADMFIKAGKPVWGPTNLWENNTGVYHIRSEKVIEQKIQINGKYLKVVILPGHQDDLINNIYDVTTPEGFSIVHTGDQYNMKDMEWIANIKKQISSPDILLVNCWTLHLKNFVNAFAPKLVITGHENEMGHTIDHREPYWLSFQKLETIEIPYVLMTWGEHYNYK